MALPPEVLERFLALQRDEEEFQARKRAFFASMQTITEAIGDRALAALQADEKALRERRAALSVEIKEAYGIDHE